MSSGVSSTGPIVVDTTVFGARLIKTRAALAKQYQHYIAGREAHISFVTEAELRFGGRWAVGGGPAGARLDFPGSKPCSHPLMSCFPAQDSSRPT